MSTPEHQSWTPLSWREVNKYGDDQPKQRNRIVGELYACLHQPRLRPYAPIDGDVHRIVQGAFRLAMWPEALRQFAYDEEL